MDIISWKPSEARRYLTALAYIKLTDAAAVAAAAANAAENAAACINILAYADDIVRLAPSWKALQIMLDLLLQAAEYYV